MTLLPGMSVVPNGESRLMGMTTVALAMFATAAGGRERQPVP